MLSYFNLLAKCFLTPHRLFYYYYFWQYFPGLFLIWCNVSHPVGLSLIQRGVCSLWITFSWEKKILKLAQGGRGGGKRIVFFQRATCVYESTRFLQPTLKNPGESLAGRISPQGESIPPSLQPPHVLAPGADEVYLCIRIAASPGSKPMQPLSPPVGNCPPAQLPGCGHWLPPQRERGMPKPPGRVSVWRVPIIQAQTPIPHMVNVVKSHYWGWSKKRGGRFTSQRYPGISQILGDLQKVSLIHRGWTPHASPLLPGRQPEDSTGDVVGIQSFLAFPSKLSWGQSCSVALPWPIQPGTPRGHHLQAVSSLRPRRK